MRILSVDGGVAAPDGVILCLLLKYLCFSSAGSGRWAVGAGRLDFGVELRWVQNERGAWCACVSRLGYP